jgi:MarR family transcriptional repressor of emrRAB
MHDSGRTANLLCATALAVADVALAGVIGAAGVSASGAAALVVLSAFHHLSVTDLGRRVDLTQFAAARMVDSPVCSGTDGGFTGGRRAGGTAAQPRAMGVGATHQSRSAGGRRVLAARAAPLTEVVAALDDDDQVALAGLLASRDRPAIHRARPGGTRFRHLAIVAGRLAATLTILPLATSSPAGSGYCGTRSPRPRPALSQLSRSSSTCWQ